MSKPGNSQGITSEAPTIYVCLVSFVAAVGGFLFGYDLNVIAGAQIYLKDYFQ